MSLLKNIFNKKILKGLIVLSLTLIISYLVYESGFSYEVVFNEKSIAYIKNQTTFHDVADEVVSDTKEKYGEDAYFQKDVEFNKVRVKKEELSNHKELFDKVISLIEIKKPAVAIVVEGVETIFVESKDVANNVFDEILNHYRNLEDVIDVSFKQTIELIEKDVDVKDILPEDMAFFLFNNVDNQSQSLRIKNNDYKDYLVAAASIVDLDYNPNVLAGEEVSVTFNDSMVDIQLTREVIENETIPFENEVKNDSSLYIGQTKISQKGVVGEKEVIYHVTYLNNDEVERTQVSEKETKAFTTQITLKGTKPYPQITTSNPTGSAAAVVEVARAQVGRPYVFGGNTPAGFDCSGLTQYVYKNALGINLPHSSHLQINYGTPISRENIQPGDLILMKSLSGSGIGHTAIYVGNGQIIHAPLPGRNVEYASINGNWGSTHYIAARRLH